MTPIEPGAWAPHLHPGERLLWEGAQLRRLRRRWSDVLQVAVGVVVTGFATVFMLASRPEGGLQMGDLWVGGGALAIGFYLVYGLTLWKRYVRARTRCALTDRRALIATDYLGRRMKSYPITADTALEYRPGDEATIIVAREPVKARSSDGHGLEYTEVGFENIADGERVMTLLRAVQAGDTGGRAS